ncbi:MAG: two-component system response regulator [Methylobacter sp.]|nr:MAG: two-component system response regulator [Methylobacter sp.]PPD04765.1 MAG: two-component system response regulator [Methylobacter sp.]
MIIPPRILIIDDVIDNIRVAMNILKERNYDFSFASNGEEAMQLIQDESGRFDLILLDIMMPRMDGFEVCSQLKANPLTRQVPIIFLTAKVDIDSISKGFELGGVDYITKPFHANELLARVKTHVDLHLAKEILKQHSIDLQKQAQHEQMRLLSELEENQKEIIYILTELMESTSDETGKHIRRVSETSALLAKYHPALNDDDVDVIFHAAPMHDIGKMTIPREILHKPGRFSPEEYEIMKAHAGNAYNLLKLSNRKYIKGAAIIAHEHHEKWDGSGYPRGLKGPEIHLYGRIVALADVFDALSHTRRYKEAWTMEQVINYIKEHCGTHFDPELVGIFLEHIDEFTEIAQIK